MCPDLLKLFFLFTPQSPDPTVAPYDAEKCVDAGRLCGELHMMGMKQIRRDREAGLSMVEILIVVLIGLLVMALALPNVLTVLANTRLRSNISTLWAFFKTAA